MTDIKPFGDELPPVIEPEMLARLKLLGLEITPHADRSYGFGYTWFGREWVGPYPTEGAAVQAAFDDALRAMRARAEAPFATEAGQLVRWNGVEWESAKYEDGKLWHFTGSAENKGWEVVEASASINQAATPGYPTGDAPVLADCLRRVERVRPTVTLALYLGDPGWMTGQEAHELVASSQEMGLGLYWHAYIEDGQGNDPAGIYTFDPKGKAWRAFDIELSERFYEAQRATTHVLREQQEDTEV